MASIAAADPAPLSVAPVPVCHESKWPPSITTSSRSAGSVPGISAMTLNNSTLSVSAHVEGEGKLHRLLLVEHPDNPPVLFARENESRIGRVPRLVVKPADAHRLGDVARRNQRGNAFAREILPCLDRLAEALRPSRLPRPSTTWRDSPAPAGAGSIWPACFFNSSSVRRDASG